jgi:nucleoside-diphosphate-sugar epimerase
MRIFVTGASGFIGQAFCRSAVGRGHQVLGLCRHAEKPLPPGCEQACGTLESIPWSRIEQFKPEVALHLAWIATPGVYLTSPENEILAEQSRRLFSGLAKCGVKHLAGVGTCIEYAASDSPLDELRSPLGPGYPYSQCKVALFQWLKEYCAGASLPWTWFRVFFPYGPGEHPGRLPTHIVNQLRRGHRVALKTPHSVKDYIYIDDLAGAVCSALEAGLTGPVNLGSGEGVSILQLARTLAGLLGADPVLVGGAEVLADDPMPTVVAETSRICSTGWSPKVSLENGLKNLIASLPGHEALNNSL